MVMRNHARQVLSSFLANIASFLLNWEIGYVPNWGHNQLNWETG